MTKSELDEFSKEGGFCRLATDAQLEAMTPAELAEEAWWSAAKSDPLRWSGTADYPVLLINYGVRALLGRVFRADGRVLRGNGSWRGFALRPRKVAQAIERLKGIRGLSSRGRMVVDLLTERMKHCRRTGVALVQNGPDRRYKDKIVKHEIFHLFQYSNRLERPSAAKSLINHFATSKALPSLRKHGGYNVGNAVSVVGELSAYIFSGDHSFVGLGRKEAEEWFSAYCRLHAIDSRQLGLLKARFCGATSS